MWGICQTEDGLGGGEEGWGWNIWLEQFVRVCECMNSTMKQSHCYKAQHSNQMIYSMNAQSKNVFAKSKIYNIWQRKIIQASKATRYIKQANWKLIIKMLRCIFCIRYIHKLFSKAVGTKQQSHCNFVKLVINSYSYNLLTPHWQIGLVWRIVLFSNNNMKFMYSLIQIDTKSPTCKIITFSH